MFGVVRTNEELGQFDYKFTKEIPDPLGGAQSVEFIAGEVQMEIFGDTIVNFNDNTEGYDIGCEKLFKHTNAREGLELDMLRYCLLDMYKIVRGLYFTAGLDLINKPKLSGYIMVQTEEHNVPFEKNIYERGFATIGFIPQGDGWRDITDDPDTTGALGTGEVHLKTWEIWFEENNTQPRRVELLDLVNPPPKIIVPEPDGGGKKKRRRAKRKRTKRRKTKRKRTKRRRTKRKTNKRKKNKKDKKKRR
jgi:hypothetical protein